MFANNLFIICLLITVGVNELMSTFVTVGEYPDFQLFGINLPNCGLSRVSLVQKISFSKNCYQNKYKNTTVVVTERSLQRRNVSNVSKRIYNGSDAEPGEAPWIVHLKLHIYKKITDEVMKGYCTGVLIALDWVLTAAHCLGIRDLETFKIEANAGSNELKGEWPQTSVATNETFFINPGYTYKKAKYANKIRDVALIKLNNGFKRFHNRDGKYLINTICLPSMAEFNVEEDTAYSYGFGAINQNRDQPKYLQKIEVKLLEYFECEEYFCSQITEENSKRPRTCPGDSGGPLVQYLNNSQGRAVLIGTVEGGHDPTIVEFGVPCGPGEILMRWIAVPNIIDWILGTIRIN